MNTDLSLLGTSGGALPAKKKFTTLTEISKTTDCPICYSFPKVSIAKNTTRKSTALEKKCPVCGKHCGKPPLLDLFSGAGGAARGYQKAGFCVLGVDIKPQPHYAGCRFIQAGALTYPLEGFHAYHASPPCQAYSPCTKMEQRSNYKKLINATRELLDKTSKPYVIENVMGAKRDMKAHILLCGTMFGLPIHRHRLFETHPLLPLLSTPCIKGADVIYITGSRRDASGNYVLEPSSEERKAALEMPWATINEMDEAIPPAYTEYIGKYLMKQLCEVCV